MSSNKFENTSIWKNTLATQPEDQYSTERDELRSAYLNFRINIKHLVSRISVDLPDLTIHDISHLDALWDTASLIAGENFQLTPLEGFIFGGAVLLHDAGLCFEAYENGHEGIRNTIQWRDAYIYQEIISFK